MNPEPPSTSQSTARFGRIAILWRGDEAARRAATLATSRFKAVFTALADVGVDAEPIVYEDDIRDAVCAGLARFDGVLVWVNPIHEGRNRANLDALLREVTARRLGERPSRCDPQDGHQGGAPSYPHDGLGLRHSPLSNGRGDARRIPRATRRRPARDQAQPRQWRPRRLEDRAADESRGAADGTRSGCHQGRIGGGHWTSFSSGALSISTTAA